MCEQNIACANQLEFSIRHGHRFDIYIEIETRRLWNRSALLKCKPQFSKLTHLPRICRGLTSIRRILRFDNLFTIHIQNEETLCMELQQAQQSCQIRINPISCQRVIDDSLRSILGTGDFALISFHPNSIPRPWRSQCTHNEHYRAPLKCSSISTAATTSTYTDQHRFSGTKTSMRGFYFVINNIVVLQPWPDFFQWYKEFSS